MAHPDQKPIGDDQVIVRCLYCEKPQPIARRAMSITCRYCNKPLRLEDVSFNKYEARRSVETCGVITIEKRGQIVADRVLCGGLVVRGRIKGNITSRGLVLVGPEAEIKGDVTAPAIAIGAGAILEGNYQIGEGISAPSRPIAG